jgi:hypothetical protein
MMRTVLDCDKFFSQLLEADREIAERVRVAGCPHCGGPLDVANYPRKPRGVPAGVSSAWSLRLSFCCGAEGCRKRRTPPSLRFWGRGLFPAALLLFVGLLAGALRPSPTATWEEPRRLRGVARRTWRRWLRW